MRRRRAEVEAEMERLRAENLRLREAVLLARWDLNGARSEGIADGPGWPEMIQCALGHLESIDPPTEETHA